MTLSECYAAMGGDYEDVLGRLRTERLVQKFVLKFLDEGSYALLEESLDAHDQETAFRAAHTIKGVCQNLSFTRLGQSSAQLTEALRDTWSPQVPQLRAQVEADYQETISAIRAYQATLPPA